MSGNQLRLIDSYRTFRSGGLAALARLQKEANFGHVHVISHHPAIVYMWWGREDRVLYKTLRHRPLSVFYLFPWCADPNDFEQIADKVRMRRAWNKNHRIVFLCNEEYCVELLRAKGVEARFINQNAFINENVYRPLGQGKKYDAVISASMAPYKRMELAAAVRSLMVLSYSYSGTTNEEYQLYVRSLLRHAKWAKDSLTDASKVTCEAMAKLYNEARIGLALSAVEGAMFASMEYLLCGLPVVTTASKGGRDVFFDCGYVLEVPADAKSVADGVDEMVSRRLDPLWVRNQVLKRVHAHRDRFRKLVEECGGTVSIPWEPGTHGITSWTNLKSLGVALERVSQQQ